MNTPEDNFTPKGQPAFSGGPPQPPKTTIAGMAGDSDDRHSLYQTFLKEREQIMKFRESESTRVGHDIGFEKAVITWVIQHRRKWLKDNG